MVKQIKSHSWDDVNKMISLIEPYIAIDDGGKDGTGCSKFGGMPDLPLAYEWPEYNGKPMIFYGQLNLSEVPDCEIDNILPKTGILYFFSFFKNPESEFGAEYDFLKSKAEYKVLFYDGDLDKISNRQFPIDLIATYQFKEMPITLSMNYKIPTSTETWNVEKIGFSENDMEHFDELTYDGDYFVADTMLGTPSPIQYGVDYDWAYASMDLDLPTVDYEDPEFQTEVDKLRPEYINLLSFTMEQRFEEIGISLCYFGITKDDLNNKNFDNVVFILQDT